MKKLQRVRQIVITRNTIVAPPLGKFTVILQLYNFRGPIEQLEPANNSHSFEFCSGEEVRGFVKGLEQLIGCRFIPIMTRILSDYRHQWFLRRSPYLYAHTLDIGCSKGDLLEIKRAIAKNFDTGSFMPTISHLSTRVD